MKGSGKNPPEKIPAKKQYLYSLISLMKIYRKIAFIIIFFLFGNLFFSQTVRFRHLTVEEGLSQNAVTAILQDKKGFIWVGTFDGLNKYDGNKIITWKGSVDDSDAIASNSIRCLYEDGEDNLWAGTTGGGMFRLNLRTNKITNFYIDKKKKNCISSDYVNAIKEYEPGKLYIATSNGLNIFDKKTETFTVIKKDGPNSIPFLSNTLKSMTQDTRGHIWFGHTDAGVTEYDPKTKKCTYYTMESKDHPIHANTVRTVFADSRGWVWISCWNFGQNAIDTKTGKIYDCNDSTTLFKNLKQASLITQYYEDRKGNIWSATAEHGLCFFNPKTFETRFYEHNPDDPETISDNTTWSICEDKSGIIWCGTWKGGVNMLDVRTARFGLYRHESNNPKSLNNNSVSGICKKSDNELYISTSAGVSVYNQTKNTFTPLPIDEKSSTSIRRNTVVYNMFRDDDNSLWISSTGAGLYRYYPDKKKYENFIPGDAENTISTDWPSALVKDKKGRLWIGSMGGGLNLYRYETKDFEHFEKSSKDPNSISSNTISSLLLRPDGKIWLATHEGLNLLDPETKKITPYIKDKNNKPYFPDVGISYLIYARNGKLWVGTSAGLCVFDEKTETAISFHKLHPVFAGRIYAIAEDNSANIWFSTSTGICRFNPATNEYKVFTSIDGLQGMEFSQSAVYKAPGGKIYFGGLYGLNAFIPEEIRQNSSAPLVALTSITVLNTPYATAEDISFTNEIELSYKEYFFAIEFAALDFTDPRKNTFLYKLEGFNEQWINNGNSHLATFTNLDPGEYTLLVKAVNNDGFESAEPCKLKIIITPPFWRTTWFYILFVLLLVGLFYLYVQTRERKLRKEKALLEEKVTERTVELSLEKKKVETAYEKLNERNKEVIDSIQYAKRIQHSLLPTDSYIEKNLKRLGKKEK
ncbi:MAG: hypothetical protein IAF38_20285 [Bacteroidia bacterium]|nr:hypothetical protein [Bacteroidia bacterium]